MPNIFHNSLSLGYPVAGPSYPTNGLIERWTFNNTLVGLNGNTWTMNNSNWEYYTDASLSVGKSIRVTAANCKGTVADTFFNTVNSDFSLSAFMLAGGVSSQNCWLGKGTFSGTSNTFLGLNNSGGYGASRKMAWVTTTEINQSGLSGNVFYHLVLTFKYSDRSMNLYINAGTPVTGTSASNMTSSGNNWQLFDPGNAWYSSANSRIGLFYIYNKVLSSAEVSQLYNGGAGV